MKTAGIYIHIPFCKNKCIYCDYYCLEKRENDIDFFVKMLHKEIVLTAEGHKMNLIFDTIYIGGGSPALLSPKDVKDILDQLKNHFHTSKQIEVTLEINPGETTKDDLLSFKESGVNRLSIGFQSLDSELLNTLSRTHNLDDCYMIIDDAKKADFRNTSIDMLYNIPGQSVENWMKNLQIVTEINPNHIAIYPLIIEEETPLFEKIKSGIITPLSEEMELEMFVLGSQYLRDSGLSQYEIAHFAKLGKECKHNQHYWNLDPYLAFGPSAHGYDGVKRWWNVLSLDDYLSKLSRNEKPIGGFETLSSLNQFNERIIFGLRTKNGILIEQLQSFKPKDFVKSSLQKWENHLEISNKTIHLKPEYYHFADEIASDIIISD